MRKLLLIAASLILSTNVFASMTFQHAHEIFIKVEKEAGMQVPFNLDQDHNINAYANSNGVTVTQGILNYVQSDAELAMVLGHELTHCKNLDYEAIRTDLFDKLRGKFFELRADRGGYRYCTRLYSGHCLDMFIRMRSQYGEMDGDGIHPSWSIRLANLGYYK
jgi:hypothetical protein